MSSRTIGLPDNVHEYVLAMSPPEHPELAALRDRTQQMPARNMQISREQGVFMAWLCSLIGAKQTIEVGVFTGYSSLAVALALPADGRVVACDISEEYTSIGKPFWDRAGVAHKIDLRIAPAADTLASLRENGEEGAFDFAFIDADKGGYPIYLEHCLALVRVGGIVAVDNVLWSGAVADPSNQEPSTIAIRAFNAALKDRSGIEFTMVPISDGLTLVRRTR